MLVAQGSVKHLSIVVFVMLVSIICYCWSPFAGGLTVTILSQSDTRATLHIFPARWHTEKLNDNWKRLTSDSPDSAILWKVLGLSNLLVNWELQAILNPAEMLHHRPAKAWSVEWPVFHTQALLKTGNDWSYNLAKHHAEQTSWSYDFTFNKADPECASHFVEAISTIRYTLNKVHVEKASEQYWQLESSCRNNSLLHSAKHIDTGDQVDQKTCNQESTHLRQFWQHRKKHHYTDDTCCEIALRLKASLANPDLPCHRKLNSQSTEFTQHLASWPDS